MQVWLDVFAIKSGGVPSRLIYETKRAIAFVNTHAAIFNIMWIFEDMSLKSRKPPFSMGFFLCHFYSSKVMYCHSKENTSGKI
jgi:hypothetical protein